MLHCYGVCQSHGDTCQILTDLAYQQWCSEQVANAIASRFTAEALEETLKARLPAVMAEYPSIRRSRPEIQLQQVRTLVEREIRSELDLPTLEQWSELEEYKDINVSLFGE